jgi:isopentenyl diphosphate isomerase/L-lactate dehydrogenase-like FMN-dependent dehydrogenase
LALGARGVFLGRSPFYALAVDSSAGVERLFVEFASGLEEALRLSGIADLAGLGDLRVVEHE